MYKRSPLHLAVLAALSVPAAANASFFEDIEINGYLKNETAFFLKDGQKTGEAKTMLDDRHASAGEVMKFENSARFFVNGLLGEESSWHLDINLICDSEGVNSDWQCHKNYTQNDWFREAYIDTSMGDVSLRLGKQQVVWGTADGVKLLDIVNPTDFREMAQNAIEDSRIPVWMVNAEMPMGESGNLQFIVAQAKPNVVAGLNTIEDGDVRSFGNIDGVDDGHPFIMKGVDTISGGVNGFFNIGAAMGGVTSIFWGGGFTDPALNPNASFATVGGYTAGSYDSTGPGFCASPNPTGISGAACLKQFTDNPLIGGAFSNNNVTNLIDANQFTGQGWDITAPNSMWEYMPNATFATFNTYVGMSTRYVRDYNEDFDANFGLRYRDSLENGLNFSVNYFYGYNPNPVVNIHWADPNTGEKLLVNEYQTVAGTTVVQLSDSSGTRFYGGNANYNPANYVGNAPTDVTAANNQGAPVLVFEETLERVHNIGGSFDYAVETSFAPVVLRVEALYQKDVSQPVIDRAALARGNLTAALRMEEADFFKYVIGVDVTVLKNLLISGQFIQYRNLDFIDDKARCTTQVPGVTVDCSRYTADPSAMHLSNGLLKGWENKEFYSLFFSKPFGESQLGRWNNITMYEDGGGWWNRFDLEYSFTDEWIGSAELNLYWGDEDTTFGQFEESSNIQVGVKYIWE